MQFPERPVRKRIVSVAVPLASVYARRMPETRTLEDFDANTLAETRAPATGVPYCVITCATTSNLSRIAAEAGGRLRSTCLFRGKHHHQSALWYTPATMMCAHRPHVQQQQQIHVHIHIHMHMHAHPPFAVSHPSMPPTCA